MLRTFIAISVFRSAQSTLIAQGRSYVKSFQFIFLFLAEPSAPAECDAEQFRCDDGTCIDEARVCDGRTDCADDSDENNCHVVAPCSADEFQCGGATGACISRMRVCDDVMDCEDGSDESHKIAGCAGESRSPANILM